MKRKEFDLTAEYSVDVSGCFAEEKKKVQQAFFDVGFFWKHEEPAGYHFLDADQYSNACEDDEVGLYLLYSSSTDNCNMTAKEFLGLVYEPEQRGHVHAENMALIAEDAKTHPEPWKLWQCESSEGAWNDCTASPLWLPFYNYRRKPKTHVNRGVEIPDLRITPELDQLYLFPDPSGESLVCVGLYASTGQQQLTTG